MHAMPPRLAAAAGPRTSIAVFARAPVAGEAKTRLIPRLGERGAAQLQAALTERALRTAVAADLGPVSLWCAPDCSHGAFGAARCQFPIRLHEQTGADLGARMCNAFEQLCMSGNVLLIGTDCPALTTVVLRRAARALGSGSDVAVVPAEDGGYVLIGMHRAAPALFETIAWGTRDVMTQTRARVRRARLSMNELAPLWDVDVPRDYDRLVASGCMPELSVVGG